MNQKKKIFIIMLIVIDANQNQKRKPTEIDMFPAQPILSQVQLNPKQAYQPLNQVQPDKIPEPS